jgi:hypothetical protein
MRTLLIQVIACFAALLPIIPAQAAEPAAKKYGDFKPGDTFTMTVSSAVNIGARPGNFPKFKKGQKVKFTIGPKGQLKSSGFSIDFEPEGTIKNESYYDNADKSTTTLVHQAVVRSKGSNPAKPYFINLALRHVDGFNVYQGTFLFEK